MRAVRLIVSGRVQGVAFRHHTQREATRLGLRGWVRNRSDGRVEIEAEGEETELEQLVAWAHGGPPAAQVTSVDRSWAHPGGHSSFEIRPTALV